MLSSRRFHAVVDRRSRSQKGGPLDSELEKKTEARLRRKSTWYKRVSGRCYSEE